MPAQGIMPLKTQPSILAHGCALEEMSLCVCEQNMWAPGMMTCSGLGCNDQKRCLPRMQTGPGMQQRLNKPEPLPPAVLPPSGGFMVGHPRMLHERRGERSARIIMAWKSVQPEPVQVGYSRPRCLNKAANPTAWCTLVRMIPLQNLKSMDRFHSLRPAPPGSTHSGLKMAVLDAIWSLYGQGCRVQSWAMCLKGPLSVEATATVNSAEDCDHLRGSLEPQQRRTLSLLLSRRRRSRVVLESSCANARIPKLGS